MAIHIPDGKYSLKAGFGQFIFLRISYLGEWRNELQLPAFFYGKDVFLKEGSLFPVIGMYRPVPVRFIAPVTGVGKSRHQPVSFPDNRAAAVIKMKVGQKNISDIITVETMAGQGAVQ